MRTSIILLCTTLLVGAGCGDNGRSGDVDAAAQDAALDGPADDAGDDAPTTDGPGGDVDAAIGTMCGAETCTTGQECCVQGSARSCVAAGTCGGVAFACDGIEDCTGGDVCCVGGAGGGSTCEAAGNCPTPTCVTANDCPQQNQQCCDLGQVRMCAVQCPGP